MARKIKCLILPIIILFSACQIFLGPDPDTSPPEILKSLWNDFNNIHANLEIRMEKNTKYNSWYDVYNAYAPKVSPDMSEDALFKVCADMLDELGDPHVGLKNHNRAYSGYKLIFTNFDLSEVKKKLNGDGNSNYKNFVYGTFEDNPDIGYIYISSFLRDDPEIEGQEWGKKIDDIIDSLANTKALILDVRSNGGGDGMIAEYIASRFASEHKDYIKSRTKNGPGPNDFSATIIRTVKSISKASNNKYGYTKPIVLLTNGRTVSAAEWFTLALKTQSHITQIGTTTCGAFSSRHDHYMINGWMYSVSPERVTDANDVCWEGEGISPDDENIIENEYLNDKQLAKAIEFLSEN